MYLNSLLDFFFIIYKKKKKNEKKRKEKRHMGLVALLNVNGRLESILKSCIKSQVLKHA